MTPTSMKRCQPQRSEQSWNRDPETRTRRTWRRWTRRRRRQAWTGRGQRSLEFPLSLDCLPIPTPDHHPHLTQVNNHMIFEIAINPISHRVPTARGGERGCGEPRWEVRWEPAAQAGQVRHQPHREGRARRACWAVQSTCSCRGDLHCCRGPGRSPKACYWDRAQNPGAVDPAPRQGRARQGPCLWQVQGAADPLRPAWGGACQETWRASWASSPGLSASLSASHHWHRAKVPDKRGAVCGRPESRLLRGGTRGTSRWSGWPGGKPYCDSCSAGRGREAGRRRNQQVWGQRGVKQQTGRSSAKQSAQGGIWFALALISPIYIVTL